ncbi:DUF4397 domain-containing protein [Ideonella sp. 4Y11]|uniref:DUF4397 domain-containing protein n=1 Tax=Ideonella aquatica TaxID=2824119 RepID=A0A940YTQ3_9BURK|nr:DUF4397 domain-containing protein [Ideonella aquatica]MBQ0961673.1 DUF4397 domain-containing protein [Ideonella aquatica]
MSEHRLSKRHFLGLMAAIPMTSLVGCGGSSSGDASLRLVNASGYDALDLYIDDERLLSSVAYGSASSYTSVSAATVTAALTNADSATYLLSQSRSLDTDTAYTVVAYGWQGALKSNLIADSVDAADSGKTKLTVLNTASDAGSLDVYLTAADDDLDASTPVAAAVDGGSSSSLTSVTAGTYRLRVTASEDTSDLRLDVASITLASTGVVTLVLMPGPGGVLVHAMQLVQDGAVTALLNTQARVRVVGGVASSATVSASVGGVSLLSGAPSPTIGSYKLVDAGSATVRVSVAGTSLTASTATLEAGGDYTLLVSGTVASPTVSVVEDDNRLPTSSSKYKLRLVNAMNGMASYPLTLTVDYEAVISDLAAGGVSDPVALNSNDAATLEVSSALSSTALYSLTDTALSAQGVYTVFMFGTSAAPSGALRKER